MADTFGLGQPYSYGRSFQLVKLGAAPAVGSNFSLTIDANFVWRLVAAQFTFAADANVANRQVTIDRQDSGGGLIESVGLGAVVAANGSAVVRASRAYTTSLAVTNGDHFCPVPVSFFQGGEKLALTAGSIQAGDAFTLIRFLFDVFPTDPERYPGIEE